MMGQRSATAAAALAVVGISWLLSGFAPAAAEQATAGDRRFTIAVIPDTQNYVDYTHQKAAGFPFDASALFLEQMNYLASNVKSAGGDIAFVTSVGDIWQHQTLLMDPDHQARGFIRASNAFWDPITRPAIETLTFEIPLVVRGYRTLAGKVPFSVVPGNHDFDAMWTHVPQSSASAVDAFTAGTLHAGGLSNFQSVFSERSEFFRDRDWYVAAHDGGADSAQIFAAGGHRFLHIGLQFDAPDASLAWAASVIKRYPGLPTIVSTHNYLDINGGRTADSAIDNHATEPTSNSPQMVWDKLISQHDQILMVLCGHRTHAFSTDRNRFGHKVYQLMSNYQSRRQTTIAAGRSRGDVGDGWLRLMTFDMTSAVPSVRVRTYSTHYGKFSTDVPEYASWYKGAEKPTLTDEEFHASDDFSIELTDFRERFMAH
jgi:3',5'-cyclic AMP phosphodiesterase CpdA